jgi:hypothetical protein
MSRLTWIPTRSCSSGICLASSSNPTRLVVVVLGRFFGGWYKRNSPTEGREGFGDDAK